MANKHFFIALVLLSLCLCGVWAHDHRRGEGEGEGERHRHHHHHDHGEGEGETGHDHSDHGGRRGPWYCESQHRYLQVKQNTIIIGKKRAGQNDVIAQFTLQSIIEKNAAGNQVVGSGLVGVQHTHAYDYTQCSEADGCVMYGDLDRNDWYQGLPVCHIRVTYVLSKTFDVETTIDFHFFKGEGVIKDGPKNQRAFYEVNRGTVRMDIQHHRWKWCSEEKQNCVIKQKRTKTFDVGTYLDFEISAITPTSGIQSPDDNTLWYVGGGAYAYFPHWIQTDDHDWAQQLNDRPVFAFPSLNAQLPHFDHKLSWGLLLTFAEPLSGWRPGGPSGPPTPPTTPSSSSAPPVTTPPISSSAPSVGVSSSANPPVAGASSTGGAVVIPPSVSSSASVVVIPPSSSASSPPSTTPDSSSSSTGGVTGGGSPPTPPPPPCIGSLCNTMDSSSGGNAVVIPDPTDNPNFNPFPVTPSSSSTGVGGVSSATGGNSGGGADSSTGSAGSQPSMLDCMVTDWTDWMPCDVLCGVGSQTRTRNIMQLPANGGSVCPIIFQIRECLPDPPVCALADCVVSAWTYWTVCSGPCGLQNRTRTIDSPQQMGGVACPALFDSRTCRQLECLTSEGQQHTPSSTGTSELVGSLATTFDPTSGNGWWIVVAVVAWIVMILGVNEYITRLWDRPKPVAEADPLMAD